VNLESALRLLDSLVNYEKQVSARTEFKLDAIRRFLKLAGNPQEKLRNVVIVAGTKGKGSVCCMLEAALRGCGVTTGLFVSPHVLSVLERIQLNGAPIDKRGFSRLVEGFAPLLRKQKVSYFELTTALAFEAFARADVDYAVVEVGLGGRLDATNLTEPQVSVITRIGYDHVQVLGNSLTAIAAEKAGIMRQGRPVVLSVQESAARAELARRARQVGAELVESQKVTRVWDIESNIAGVSFSVLGALGAGRVRVPLLGRHQVENCTTALTALGLLAKQDPRIRFEPVVGALAEVLVPARCHVVRQDPVVIVDSCHNPESGAALAAAIAEVLKQKVVLVFGALRGKLIARTVAPLAPWTEHAVLVQPDSPRAAELVVLKQAFGRFDVPYSAATGIADALKQARELSGGTKPIVVAGSFYLAGEALGLLAG
jgi:dihydrofolate synthase / folylpolyglutamate synthase